RYSGGVMPKKTLRCIRQWCLISQGFVFSYGVVFDEPIVSQLLSMLNGAEYIGIQNVLTIRSVKSLNNRILLRRSLWDGTPFNTILMQPNAKPFGHHFRAVVTAYSFRFTVLFYESIQKSCCSSCGNADGVQDPKCLTIIMVDDVEGSELPSVL